MYPSHLNTIVMSVVATKCRPVNVVAAVKTVHHKRVIKQAKTLVRVK